VGVLGRLLAVGDVVRHKGSEAPLMEVKQVSRTVPGALQTLICEWRTDGILRTDLLTDAEVETPGDSSAPLPPTPVPLGKPARSGTPRPTSGPASTHP
jgi:hypothetical protein